MSSTESATTWNITFGFYAQSDEAAKIYMKITEF